MFPATGWMSRNWRLLWCLAAGQAGIAVFLSLCLIIIGENGYGASLSALLGGAVAVFATLSLGIRMLAVDKEATPKQIVKAFYLAEMWRIATVVVAFAVIFLSWDSVRALWLLVAFSLGMLAHGMVLLLPAWSR